MTYGGIRQIVGNSYSDAEILSSVQYLCGERVHLLDVGFELIEEDNYIPIESDEMRVAQKTGKLLHPETGQLLENYEDHVFLYFSSSEFSKQINES